MVEYGVSAFIISPAYGAGSDTFDAILRAARPTMQVLRKVDPRADLFPFSGPDYLDGSRTATRHLLDQGARRIAFVGGLEGRDVTRERMAGYLETLQHQGVDPLVLMGRSSWAFGREMAFVLAEQYPSCDAVLCFNDLLALGMLAGCNELGRKLGTDFKVVGFDDIEDAARSYPPLGSVRYDVAEFGRKPAATILGWLEAGQVPDPESRSPVALIIRQSSQPQSQ